MIFPLVREMAAAGARVRVPVVVACRVLGFSTQGYYKWLKEPVCERDRDDAEVLNVLHDVHQDGPTLGYRFLKDELEHEGIVACENLPDRWFMAFPRQEERKEWPVGPTGSRRSARDRG